MQHLEVKYVDRRDQHSGESVKDLLEKELALLSDILWLSILSVIKVCLDERFEVLSCLLVTLLRVLINDRSGKFEINER